jgi:hypothetical protein
VAAAATTHAANHRVYVVVADAEVAPDVPPGLAAEANHQLWLELSKRRDLTVHPEREPVDEIALSAQATRQKLKVYKLFVRVSEFRGHVEPPIAGKRYHTLSVGLRLTVIGAQLPGDTMALSGDGDAEVTTEINGKEPTLDDKRQLGKEALASAVGQAARKAMAQLKHFRPMKAPIDRRR